MKVALSRSAEADLEDIAGYIKQDSPRAAVRTVAELQRKCMELARFPQRFQRLSNDGDVRRRVVGSYVIFYEVTLERVEVLRILQGARDYRPLF